MAARPFDQPSSRGPSKPFERPAAHVGTLVVALLVLGGSAGYLAVRVINALPEVGKDVSEREPWVAPVAVERLANGVLLGHVPSCAQAGVVGLFLWDDDDNPFWLVEGDPTTLDTFILGIAPAGFRVVHPTEVWRPDQTMHVGVLRTTGGPVGTAFRPDRLRAGQVRYKSGWVTVDHFRSVARCPKPSATDRRPAAGSPTSPSNP